MRKIATILAAIFTLASIYQVHAYCSSENFTDTTLSENMLESSAKQKDTGQYFYLLDNFTKSANPGKKKILTRSNNVIPADYIPFNFPLYNIFSHQQPNEISTANMLYANLRLTKLLEDYERLQKNARELLSDIENSPRQVSDIVTSNIGEKAGEPKKPSIFKTWQKLKTENKSIGHIATRVSPKTTQQPCLAFGASLPKLKSISENVGATDFPSRNLGTMNHALNIPGSSKQYSGQSSQNTQAKAEPNFEQKKRRVTIDDASRSWIGRFFLNLYKYVDKNKIEATILFVIFIMVLNFFAAIFKK